MTYVELFIVADELKSHHASMKALGIKLVKAIKKHGGYFREGSPLLQKRGAA